MSMRSGARPRVRRPGATDAHGAEPHGPQGRRDEAGPRRPPGRNREITLFRYVPGDSAVHRLWAGTKIGCMVALTILFGLYLNWPVEGLMSALLVVLFVIARLPLAVLPILPARLWALIIGADLAFSGLSGGPPGVHVGHRMIGLGGAETACQFLLATIEVLVLLALVGWTTAPGESAGSLAGLLRPLARMGVPIEEVASTISLCARCIPLVLDELRILGAARRLHHKGRPAFADAQKVGEVFDEAVDLSATALAVSVRRAQEMGDAIAARGGYGAVTGVATHPSRRDVVAVLLTVAVMVAMALL